MNSCTWISPTATPPLGCSRIRLRRSARGGCLDLHELLVRGGAPLRFGRVGKLLYSAITSLDGYVADEHGKWDWSVPDHEVHAVVNDLTRPFGTWLLGRRMYDVLVAWETMDDPDPIMREFAAVWRGADKVVYSRTLDAPS